jgi:hypothetical protein
MSTSTCGSCSECCPLRSRTGPPRSSARVLRRALRARPLVRWLRAECLVARTDGFGFLEQQRPVARKSVHGVDGDDGVWGLRRANGDGEFAIGGQVEVETTIPIAGGAGRLGVIVKAERRSGYWQCACHLHHAAEADECRRRPRCGSRPPLGGPIRIVGVHVGAEDRVNASSEALARMIVDALVHLGEDGVGIHLARLEAFVDGHGTEPAHATFLDTAAAVASCQFARVHAVVGVVEARAVERALEVGPARGAGDAAASLFDVVCPPIDPARRTDATAFVHASRGVDGRIAAVTFRAKRPADLIDRGGVARVLRSRACSNERHRSDGSLAPHGHVRFRNRIAHSRKASPKKVERPGS